MRLLLSFMGVLVASISMITTEQTDYTGYSIGEACELNERRPNLLDQHSFYWCLINGPVLMRCVDGMYFDATVSKCIDESKGISDNVDKASPIDSVELPEDEGKLRCPQLKTPPRGIRCPPVDPIKYSIYFPDPQACDCFYQCDNTVPKRIPCRKDLHFNRTTNLCDWPEEAGCILQHRR